MLLKDNGEEIKIDKSKVTLNLIQKLLRYLTLYLEGKR